MPKEDVVVVAMKEDVASAQDEVYAKVMDDTIVRGVIIDLTNTGVTTHLVTTISLTIKCDISIFK